MQDIQNIPVPDDDSSDPNENLGSHSNVRQDLDNDEEKSVDEAGNLVEPEEENPQTGFEQVPRNESERTDIERP